MVYETLFRQFMQIRMLIRYKKKIFGMSLKWDKLAVKHSDVYFETPCMLLSNNQTQTQQYLPTSDKILHKQLVNI